MNKKWKIVVTDYLEKDMNWEASQLSGPDVQFDAYQLKHAHEDTVIEHIREADIVVVDMMTLTTRMVDSLEKCRLLVRHGVGYDNIDVKRLTEMGIIFTNIPDYCIETVAEQALMLIFVAARKFAYQQKCLERSIVKGAWYYQGLYPIYSLDGKTLGIIGCGRIGSKLLQMMRGFDMEILVCDPYLTPERQAELGIKTVPLEDVMRKSDIITLHTLLNEETHHLIDEPQLKMMKPTAFIVNTARGGNINQDALVRACKENWIAGAATDVFEFREPPESDDSLLNIENLTLSPHLGWYSEEARFRIREKMVDNIKRLIDGQLPNNIINPEVLEK